MGEGEVLDSFTCTFFHMFDYRADMINIPYRIVPASKLHMTTTHLQLKPSYSNVVVMFLFIFVVVKTPT